MDNIYKKLIIFSRKVNDPREFIIPKVKFAIMGGPRTGSSYLHSKLDSHPHITCWNSEVFNKDCVFDRSQMTMDEFLNTILFKVKTKVVGFKFLYDAMLRIGKANDVAEFLNKYGIQIVHIQRANLLDQVISLKLAQINNVWSTYYGQYTTDQIELDPEFVKKRFEFITKYNEDIYKMATNHHVPYFTLSYDKLINDELDELFTYLKVKPMPTSSKLQKQRIKTQANSVKNYNELKEYFKDTEHYKYFVD